MTIKAPDRIYAQYRAKPKAVQWYGIIPAMQTQFSETFNTIRKMYDIDTMAGAQLDIIARIVGSNRSYDGLFIFDFDACGDTDVNCGEPDVMFKPLTGDIDQNVSDDIFRLLIKSKINLNNSNATYEDILRDVRIIVPDASIRIVDNEDYTFNIIIRGSITPNQKFIFDNFDVIPRPQATSITIQIEPEPDGQYGGVSQYGKTTTQYQSGN